MSKPERILRRLKLDPVFKELSLKAKEDPGNIKRYVAEARKHLALSGYWEVLLEHILLQDKFDERLLAGGAVIESEHDIVTDRMMYKIIVYPETTRDDVSRAYTSIIEEYKDNDYQIDIRKSKLAPIKARILELSNAGKNNKDILAIIEIEFDEPVTLQDIPNLLAKAKKKKL